MQRKAARLVHTHATFPLHTGGRPVVKLKSNMWHRARKCHDVCLMHGWALPYPLKRYKYISLSKVSLGGLTTAFFSSSPGPVPTAPAMQGASLCRSPAFQAQPTRTSARRSACSTSAVLAPSRSVKAAKSHTESLQQMRLVTGGSRRMGNEGLGRITGAPDEHLMILIGW